MLDAFRPLHSYSRLCHFPVDYRFFGPRFIESARHLAICPIPPRILVLYSHLWWCKRRMDEIWLIRFYAWARLFSKSSDVPFEFCLFPRLVVLSENQIAAVLPCLWCRGFSCSLFAVRHRTLEREGQAYIRRCGDG